VAKKTLVNLGDVGHGRVVNRLPTSPERNRLFNLDHQLGGELFRRNTSIAEGSVRIAPANLNGAVRPL
jgi:hypothetical protein